jgi:DNA-binding LytR/AlgR family response regulator
MIKCLIIEDEPLAAERLKNYIAQMPELQLERWFDTGTAAAAYLEEHSVDLIFLDLHLGETSGIHLLEQKKLNAKIIITTAFHQYAVKSYEWDVVDYLMKPFVFDRFEAAVNKALRKQIGEELFIMIRSEYKQEKIFLKDILFIEGMGDYRRLHTNRRKIMTLQTFKELESMLSESSIQRVHKSYMINVDNIVQRTSEYVMLTNGERIPISDSYKGNFK